MSSCKSKWLSDRVHIFLGLCHFQYHYVHRSTTVEPLKFFLEQRQCNFLTRKYYSEGIVGVHDRAFHSKMASERKV